MCASEIGPLYDKKRNLLTSDKLEMCAILLEQFNSVFTTPHLRSDDWVEALPSQRHLQFICSYFLLLHVSTNLFVFSSFHVVLFSI